MKRLLLTALLIISTICRAQAQQVVVNTETRKALNLALSRTDDKRKAARKDTWIALGKAYMASWEAGDFGMEDNPDKAFEAYQHAALLDVRGHRTSTISKGMAYIVDMWTDQAHKAYSDKEYSLASQLYEKAFFSGQNAPLSRKEDVLLYDAAIMAWAAGEYERGASLFEQCRDMDYGVDAPDFHAKLADCYLKSGQDENARAALEYGLRISPDDKSLLLGLIDFHCSGPEPDNDLVLSLIERVRRQDPNNCELLYLEGDFHVRKGETDRALECFARSFEINPSYEYGLIGSGSVWYNRALDVLEEASTEVDDRKFTALAEEFKKDLEIASGYFQQAFDMTSDKDVRLHTARYLRNIWHRFASIDSAAAEKYAYFRGIVGD